MPMSLFLFASISTDTLTISIAFLLTACLLRLGLDGSAPITRKDWFILALLSVLIALAKPTYLVILGLYFLIPRQKIGSWMRYFAGWAVLVIPSLVLAGLWAAATSGLITNRIEDAHIVPGEQVMFILAHPIQVGQTFFHTLFAQKIALVNMFIGILGWLDTPLPKWIYLSFSLVLLLIAIFDHHRNFVVETYQKILFGLVFLQGLTALYLVMYLFSTAVGGDTIIGVQGRYLIPLAPFALLVFYNHKTPAIGKTASWLVPLYSILVLVVTLFTIAGRYYALA